MGLTLINPEELNTAAPGQVETSTARATVFVAAAVQPDPEPAVVGPRARLVEAYIVEAVRHARFAPMDDARWYADIAGFHGVWGEGADPGEAERDLAEGLHSWVLMKLDLGAKLPELDGLNLSGL